MKNIGRLLLAFVGASHITSAALSADKFPVPTGFKSEYRDVDGVRMHYVKGGSGPLVYLVHGFGQTWYKWHDLMPLLANYFTVVAPDIPGLGDSAPPKTSYTGQDVSVYLYKLAKSFSPNKQIKLVAHDIGIWNTYPMLAMHQADFDRVVMIEAPIPDDGLYGYPAFAASGESLVWHFSFFAAEGALAETLVQGKERFFWRHFMNIHSSHPEIITPALIDKYADSVAKPGRLHASFEYYRQLNETVRLNKHLQQAKLGMPILAVGGGDSFGHAEADQVAQFASRVEGKVVPGCGHWLPEECGAATNPLIVDFLKTDK